MAEVGWPRLRLWREREKEEGMYGAVEVFLGAIRIRASLEKERMKTVKEKGEERAWIKIVSGGINMRKRMKGGDIKERECMGCCKEVKEW